MSLFKVLVYGGARRSIEEVSIEGFFFISNFFGFLNTRKSLIDYVFNAYGIAITWKTSFRKVVPISTTEAEYIAMAKAAKKALWLKGLVEELKVQDKVVIIYYDNSSVI